MDIITFSEGLQKRIKEIDTSVPDPSDIMRNGKALSTIRGIITELKQFTIKYTFNDAQEEIRFFKEIKPVLLSQYFYYKKVFSIALFDSFRDRRSRIENYYRILQKLQNFARKNQAFYEYCMAGSTYLDSNYFMRNNQNLPGLDRDEKFTTGYDKLLSKILAHELIKQFIMDALRRFQEDRTGSTAYSIPWTGSKVALIELIYALHATGVLNYGKADIKQIALCFEEIFSIDLSNYARMFSDIRIRKSGQTNFLDQLRERLSQIINDLN